MKTERIPPRRTWPILFVVTFVFVNATVQVSAESNKQTAYNNPNLAELFAIRGSSELGVEDFATQYSRCQKAIADEVVFQRILAVLHDNTNVLLDHESPRWSAVMAAMDVLQFSQRDEVVSAIGSFLATQPPRYHEIIVDHLLGTGNPKAIGYLVAGLMYVEKTLPSYLPNPQTSEPTPISESLNTIGVYFEKLAAIGSNDAISALNDSLARLQGRHKGSPLASKMIRVLGYMRENKGKRPPRDMPEALLVPNVATLPPQSVNDAISPSNTPAAVTKPESVGFLPWCMSLVALSVCLFVIRHWPRRRKGP